MSSFFTTPASQRKRKRTEPAASISVKRSSLAPTNRRTNPSTTATSHKNKNRDESISGSESEFSGAEDNESRSGEDVESSNSEYENETAAEKRLRLAESYLENLQDELDPAAFDAAEIDRDLIAERLKEDVAESKGKIYRHITDQLAFSTASCTKFRADQFCLTGVATALPYVYTIAKDITICKWQLPGITDTTEPKQTNIALRRKPKLLKRFTGFASRSKDQKYLGHTGPIMCVAASSSGKYIATGGSDRRLVIWDAETLKPTKVFFQHRDSVLSVSFRRNTHTLFTASADRTIKLWSLDEMTYIETLFGHQDQIVDIVGLTQEMCISVGSRDRTARVWKVIEESQLVFRGGSTGASKDSSPDEIRYAEGSIERVAMVDEDIFVTGSDNGSISLWNVQRKKPIHFIPLAHGADPLPKPEEISADIVPNPKVDGRPTARWITALATLPYSDLILSGSWDGYIRVWRISEDKRRIERVGTVSAQPPVPGATAVFTNATSTLDDSGPVRGFINQISISEKGDRGKDGLCIIAAVSQEHRLGKWKRLPKGRSDGILFEVSRSTLATLNRTLPVQPATNGASNL